MKAVAFEDLSRLPVMEFYETAFRKATGVSLAVIPPDQPQPGMDLGDSENPFCSLAACTPAGCALCAESEARVVRHCARELETRQLYCYAGLTVAAMPVMIGGCHVATLLSGRVFRRAPTERDFAIIVKMIGGGMRRNWEKKAHEAYFATPVVTAGQFEAILQLLKVFAQYLADFAGRHAIAASDAEPIAVASAKQFVLCLVGEPATLSQVVEHVHLSRFYFCKLFKRTTGMTFTEYVSRVRVEKAKTLLNDPISANLRDSFLPPDLDPFRGSIAFSSTSSACRRASIALRCGPGCWLERRSPSCLLIRTLPPLLHARPVRSHHRRSSSDDDQEAR